MPGITKQWGPEVQYVPNDTQLDDLLYLIKRDGLVIVRNLVSEEDVDHAHNDVKDRLEDDPEWDGSFFPKETKRAPGMIARSLTYTKTQVMNPTFQAVCDHFLTTRSWNWWGETRKESVSRPYVTSCTAMSIGPGGKAQPLHRDDYINHNHHEELTEWTDEPYKRRETAVGLMVAGCRITKENGGTQFIPGSHLWGSNRKTPPKVEQCSFADMNKGDGLIMLSSVFHGGGHNSTTDQHRLMFSTFVIRGHLRQEENQFLSVPQDKVKQYDRETQKFIGYSISDPACGYVDELDPIYVLYPEELKDAKPTDF